MQEGEIKRAFVEGKTVPLADEIVVVKNFSDLLHNETKTDGVLRYEKKVA